MGYYSQVAIGMRKEDAARMLEEFSKAFPGFDLLGSGYDGMKMEDDKHTIIYWSGIKWYTEDKERGTKQFLWIEEFLNSLDEDNNPWALIRVGEAADDVEDTHNSCEVENWEIHEKMEVVRGIDFMGAFNTQFKEFYKPTHKDICPSCGAKLEHDYMGSFGMDEAKNTLTVWYTCPGCKKEVAEHYTMEHSNSEIVEDEANA